MMTKLIRPCTIEDEQGTSITIDALDVTDFDVLNCMLTIEHQYQEHLHFFSKSTSEIFRIFNAKLYNALNAPVRATDAVIEAMNAVPDAVFMLAIKDKPCRLRLDWDNGHEAHVFNGEKVHSQQYVKAGCPKALEVLLQFNTKGELNV